MVKLKQNKLVFVDAIFLFIFQPVQKREFTEYSKNETEASTSMIAYCLNLTLFSFAIIDLSQL